MNFSKEYYRKPTLSKAFKIIKNIFVSEEEKVNAISLFDLPANSVRVKLKKNFREELFYKLLRKQGSFSNISESAGLTRGETARRYFIERSGMPLSFLIKAIQTLGISEEIAEKNVTELRSIKSKERIKNPRLPFKVTADLALVVGGVLGDGGIENKKCRVLYFNKEKQQIQSFVSSVRNAFGDVEFSWHSSISGTPCVIFPRIVGIILKSFELEDGNKNYQNNQIPPMLVNCKDKRIKVALLQRLFDDDGTVVNHHNNRCVSFTSPKTTRLNEKATEPKILLDIKKILAEFGIKSNICIAGKNLKEREITRNWEIRITAKENLITFHREIGFGLERKQKKLQAMLGRYVEGLEFYPRGEAKKHYLEKIKKINSENIDLTSANLSKFCKRSHRHIRDVLITLYKEGMLSRHQKGNKFIYEVTQ